jgi:hypothetical protein
MNRHVQTQVTSDIHRKLHDLAYETRRSVGSLVLDGLLLVLRFHDRADGLPEPLPPTGTAGR